MDDIKPVDKIFEALGKLDNIYRDDYREATAILDDLLIRITNLEKIKEAALDVSLANDGVFEMKDGKIGTRESAMDELNGLLSEINRLPSPN